MKTKYKFTKKQWQRVSELLGSLGLLMAGATFIPAIFDVHKVELPIVLYGLLLSISCIMLSIIVARKS